MPPRKQPKSSLITVGVKKKFVNPNGGSGPIPPRVMQSLDFSQTQGSARSSQRRLTESIPVNPAAIINTGTINTPITNGELNGQSTSNLNYNMMMSRDSPPMLATPIKTLSDAYLGDRRAARASASIK